MKNTIVLMGLLFLAITAKGQSWKTSFTTRGTGEHAQLAESSNGNIYLGFRDFHPEYCADAGSAMPNSETDRPIVVMMLVNRFIASPSACSNCSMFCLF